MNVWRDMGFLADGSTFGVDPFAFLSTAYDFWRLLGSHSGATVPDIEFAYCWKGHEPAINTWSALNFILQPGAISSWSGWIGGINRPVPEASWNNSPDWAAINALSTAAILGETVIECPYRSSRDVMLADWPRQRLKLIRLSRYMVVPLDGAPYLSGYYQWDDGKTLTASFPAYWQQATSRKIGVNGESGKPVSGQFWQADTWSFTYTGDGTDQQLSVYGAVDLTTHPDFEQYFDVN